MMRPTSGPLCGATLVKIWGVNFADGFDYICKIGMSVVHFQHLLDPPHDRVLFTLPTDGVYTMHVALKHSTVHARGYLSV